MFAFVSPETRFVAELMNATKRPSAEIERPQSPLLSFPCVPSVATLTRSVVPLRRSRTKMSRRPFVSPATRFEAALWNATKRPSAEIEGARAGMSPLLAFPCVPSVATLTRSVVPLWRSRTKMSSYPFVSPAMRFEAALPNATNRPSAEIEAPRLLPFPCAPAESTLTRSVVPVWRSRTKTSCAPFVSPGTRLVAPLANATKRPSVEIEG